jgi:hypothetical protein
VCHVLWCEYSANWLCACVSIQQLDLVFHICDQNTYSLLQDRIKCCISILIDYNLLLATPIYVYL